MRRLQESESRENTGAPKRRRRLSECGNGHEWSKKTTYVSPRGDRQCRTCLAAASRAYRERNLEAVRKRERERKKRAYYQTHYGEPIP